MRLIGYLAGHVLIAFTNPSFFEAAKVVRNEDFKRPSCLGLTYHNNSYVTAHHKQSHNEDRAEEKIKISIISFGHTVPNL